MAVYKNSVPFGNIVTDGLVLNLDATNINSYPGSGTTWTDTSFYRNSGSLVNGPTFLRERGRGSIVFDGVNDYAAINNTIGNFNTSNFTISLVFKTTSTSNPATFIAKSIGDNPTSDYGWLINQASPGDLGFAVATAAGSWGISGTYTIKTSGANINNGGWKFATIVVDKSQTDVTIYINGSTVSLQAYAGKASLTTIGNVSNSRILNIASESDVGGASQLPIAANVSVVQIYNKALSAQEVQQNYNALKSRFGL